MINGFGFGGQNAVAIFRRFEADGARSERPSNASIAARAPGHRRSGAEA